MTFNEILWSVVIVSGLLLEGVSFKRQDDSWQPLTYYIRKYVPHVLVAAGVLWLATHFDVLM
jgi:hypothetical protein